MYAKYKNNPLVEVVGVRGKPSFSLCCSLAPTIRRIVTNNCRFSPPSLFEPLGENFDCCQRGMCALHLSYYNKLALLRDTRGYHCNYFVYIKILQLYFNDARLFFSLLNRTFWEINICLHEIFPLNIVMVYSHYKVKCCGLVLEEKVLNIFIFMMRQSK